MAYVKINGNVCCSLRDVIGGRECFHAKIWDVFGNLCEGGYVRAAFSFFRLLKVLSTFLRCLECLNHPQLVHKLISHQQGFPLSMIEVALCNLVMVRCQLCQCRFGAVLFDKSLI